jgi:hypothetical protein
MAKLGSAASPPRPPGSSSRPSDYSSSSSRRSSSASTSSNRPPLFVVIAMAVNALFSLGLLLIFSDSITQSVLGVVFGMFGSVTLLGIFRQQINLARADGKFMDWRISSNSVATVMAVAAWLAGAGSLFLLCYEFSRNFTS